MSQNRPYRDSVKHRIFDALYVLWRLDVFSSHDYELPPNFDPTDFFDVWWLIDDEATGVTKRCKWIR